MVIWWFLRIFTLPLLLAPGFLLARLLARDDYDCAEQVFLGISLGTYLVSYTAVAFVGVVGLFTQLYVRSWLLFAASAVWTLPLLWLLARRGRLLARLRLPRPGRGDWIALAVGLGLLIWAMLHYDRMFFDEERCLIRSSVLPYFNYLRPDLPMMKEVPPWMLERNPFLFWNGGQREGMSFVLTPFLALFEYLGFRLCFAFQHFAIAGSAYVVTRRLLGRRWLAVLVMVLVCANPYTATIVDVDDNIFGLALGSLSLSFLLRKPVPWFWFMLPYGLFIGVRHEGLLTLPAVLLFAWQGGLPWRQRLGTAGRVILGTALFTFPFVLYHLFLLLVFQVPYEAFTALEPVPHSFFGHGEFGVRGLLNWPFHPELVRSPFTAFPPLVGFPLELASKLGLALWALVPGGLWWLWTRQRRFLGLSLLWVLPFLALLLVQSNWTEPDKMGIPITVLLPIPVWAACGLAALLHGRGSWLRRAAVPVVALVLCAGAVGSASLLDFPVDERGFGFRPTYMPAEFPLDSLRDDAAYAEAERARLTRPVLLPWLQGPRQLGLSQLGRVLHSRAGTLAQDLANPQFAYYRPSIPEAMRNLAGLDDIMHFPVSSIAEARGSLPLPGVGLAGPEQHAQPVVLELDLSLPPIENPTFLRVAEGPGPLPLSAEPGVLARVADIPLDWAPLPGTVSQVNGYFTDVTLSLSFGHMTPECPRGRVQVACSSGARLREPVLRVELPQGGVMAFVEISSFMPTRRHIWMITLDGDDQPVIVGPVAQ